MAVAVGWLAVSVAVQPAAATWSIVAVDPSTGEVGAAIASCVDLPSWYYRDDGVLRNIVVAPGVGAAITQARINLDAAARIRADLESGAGATATVDDVTAGTFDSDSAQRQHAVVRLDAPAASAAYTGTDTPAWSGHRTADGVSVQGNILRSERVVANTLASFSKSGQGTLVDRLIRSLLAGSRAGGDSRCAVEQTALFAQVAVITGDGRLDVRTARVEKDDGRNPVQLLADGRLTGPPALLGGHAAGVLIVGILAGIAIAITCVLLLLRRRRRSRRRL